MPRARKFEPAPKLERRRVRRLMTVLRHVTPEMFNMDLWAEKIGKSCNTVACAAGHSAMDPKLRAQGLRLKRWRLGCMSGVEVAFRSRTEIGALRAFFGITYEEAMKIFVNAENYHGLIRPHHVNRKLEQLLARDTAGRRRGERVTA